MLTIDRFWRGVAGPHTRQRCQRRGGSPSAHVVPRLGALQHGGRTGLVLTSSGKQYERTVQRRRLKSRSSLYCVGPGRPALCTV
eukprot:1422934-Rhodomonas_salina.1